MNIFTIKQWQTKSQQSRQAPNANFYEDGMADDYAPVPLPFRDLILALSQSDVLCSRRLEALASVISATNFF